MFREMVHVSRHCLSKVCRNPTQGHARIKNIESNIKSFSSEFVVWLRQHGEIHDLNSVIHSDNAMILHYFIVLNIWMHQCLWILILLINQMRINLRMDRSIFFEFAYNMCSICLFLMFDRQPAFNKTIILFWLFN